MTLDIEEGLGCFSTPLGAAGAINCQMGRGAGSPVNRVIGSAPGPSYTTDRMTPGLTIVKEHQAAGGRRVARS